MGDIAWYGMLNTVKKNNLLHARICLQLMHAKGFVNLAKEPNFPFVLATDNDYY